MVWLEVYSDQQPFKRYVVCVGYGVKSDEPEVLNVGKTVYCSFSYLL